MAALVRIRLALAGSRRSSGTWLGCVRLALGRPSRQVRRARIFTALPVVPLEERTAQEYAGDLFNKIPAGSTKRLLDQELIGTESAPTVVGILLEVRVR